MSACQGTLGIIGAILTGVVAYISAHRVARARNYNQAAAAFRSAFSKQLYQLERGRDDVFEIFNDDAYVSHLKARIEYEPYLSKGERRGLSEAWMRYFQYRNLEGQQVAPGSVDTRQKEVKHASEILNEVLEFARYR